MGTVWVAGADGCKRGWVLVLREVGSGEILLRDAAELGDVFRWKPMARVLGVDVPIGLLDKAVPGGRECDIAARRLLGRLRASSVFTPPARRALEASSYREAVRLNRSTSPHRLGISVQTFGIFPKLREVDRLISRTLQKRIVEVHPELCFCEMNGGKPLEESKKEAAGQRRRIRLLENAWKRKLSALLDGPRPTGIGRDDILDAMAACWTAERILRRKEIRLPEEPPRDSRGLRMEIVR